MMKNTVESLLEDDHALLGQLLTQLDTELAKPNLARAFELLDLFWARLAVHIRAESLHLFPAIANADPSLFTGEGSLPTFAEAQTVLRRLRLDHDLFMNQLALIMKAARVIRAGQVPIVKEAEELRRRLTVMRKRLKTHNRLEEKRVYTWPSLLFDETTTDSLGDRFRHELENLPPRFAECDHKK